MGEFSSKFNVCCIESFLSNVQLAWEGVSVGLANQTNQRGTELMLPDSEEESGQVSHAPSNTLRDRNIIPSFFNIELSSETARVVIADLSHHFNTALERFHTLGAQTFFLNDPSNTNNPSQEGSIDQHQVCWFAKEAWNAGVVAAKHGLLQSAVVLMGAAGDFSAAVPNCTDPEIVKQRQVGLKFFLHVLLSSILNQYIANQRINNNCTDVFCFSPFK